MIHVVMAQDAGPTALWTILLDNKLAVDGDNEVARTTNSPAKVGKVSLHGPRSAAARNAQTITYKYTTNPSDKRGLHGLRRVPPTTYPLKTLGLLVNFKRGQRFRHRPTSASGRPQNIMTAHVFSCTQHGPSKFLARRLSRPG